MWDDSRRRAEACLLWPGEPYRDDRSILVAGCGTVQAAHYAVRWPHAQVVGIDVSANSLGIEAELRTRHGLPNLELHELPIERAGELERTFDHIVCTGVLHHLGDPDAGLRALRSVLKPGGSIHIMLYAPYGRAGIYMLADYCRKLGVGWTKKEIRELAATLRALPQDHPLAALIATSPDFATEAGLADALLHPNDRPYSVAQLLDLIERNGLIFGRWVRQAPYLPYCGAFASTPHASILATLPSADQYAAMELFRGTMVRHSFIAHQGAVRAIDFRGDAWPAYVPLRLPDTVTVREELPAGASAVLINRNHTYTDLWLPIDGARETLLNGIDGRRTIAEIAGENARGVGRAFFEQLWRWDQAVFEVSGSKRPIQ